ncbi:peroxiredoxin [uncultured Devosia sp.]|uniref:peroxiredoxin n=1 Tax=uncultured Devosia sp. TaxID=211434 RepID=UPI0035CACEB4
MTKAAEGEIAPDFTLPRDDGANFTLSAYRGQPVVLFFYPQDDTEGCTIENQEFSALAPEFTRRGAVLVGISPDSVAQHCKFRDKYGLSVPLVADPDRVAVTAFGLWQWKVLYGREYEGLVRTSFLIDADGRIAKVVKATRIKGHAAKMLAAVDALRAPAR